MKLTTRHRARERSLQAIYSWKISRNNISDIEKQFLIDYNMKDVDTIYFHKLCSGIVMNFEKLDTFIIPYLSCHSNSLGYIEHIILYIALFELITHHNIPYKVVINEAIELTKTFGSENSYKFINGVLDKVAIKIRPNKK